VSAGAVEFELPEEALATARALAAAFPYETDRSHPDFPALARRVTRHWAGLGQPEDENAPPLRDISRFAAVALAVYLEATPGGLTLVRIRALIERPGLGGIGHGRAVLIFLRYIGHIEPLPREGDGRMQRYAVTARARELLRLRFRRELTAIGDWNAAAAAMIARLDDDDAFRAFLVAIGENTLAAMRNDPRPENPVGLFSSRAGGLVLLCTLMQGAGPDDTFPPRGGLPCNVAELARTSQASRMQVRHLLNRARDAGYLLPEADGKVRLSEELCQGMERMIASLIQLTLHSCRRVLNR
jgi:hypothetical protein